MNSELVKYKRMLKINLPKKQSAFLWGARKTGKSTYLADKFPQSIKYDLLKSEYYLRYSKQPYLFREEILALPETALRHPIIIDEVQKIPLLLDEVHWLIENTNAYFILCGSSARKLKRTGANLLGGRAWRYTFYPLVYSEIPNFNLLRALNFGLIPDHYCTEEPQRLLQAYVIDYLTQEIQAESLVRNLPDFACFLDTLAFSNGELINYTNIARDCAIDAKTVKSYYEIIVDTLLGYFILPYKKKIKRETIVSTPKFYLFDIGLVNFLIKRHLKILKGAEAGKAFENYILHEIIAYRGINNLDFDITFWRTKTGLEVDFILGKGEIALEVKISESVNKKELRGLIAFVEEHRPKKALVVSLDLNPRKILLPNNREIIILPYRHFLEMLWQNEII